MSIPRCEHPRPQFVRENWVNLNGSWQFEIDNGKSGIARKIYEEGVSLSGEITVPFCPESELSGVGNKEFMYGVWYKKQINIDSLEGRVFLHFGAVDYIATVFVNGIEIGKHKGGYVSFSFEITSALRVGNNEIAVYAEDDTRDRLVPSGKQCMEYHSRGCSYTRTTGIWQTVWLEFAPCNHVKCVKYYPNITDTSVTIEAELEGTADFCCKIAYDGKDMGCYCAKNAAGRLSFNVKLAEEHLWEVGCGRLYDVTFTFGDDKVTSYFGLREVRLDGMKFLINNKSVFQRLILDQGFYPDGIYTAPTDEALENDIKLSLACGFNGARLHEKVFEERFLYHADRLGYIVWGEYPDWGLDHTYGDNVYSILPEWIEEVKRDFNHPAIIGWCPHNETWHLNDRKQDDASIEMVYNVTKALDNTRPCIDSSGGKHVKTDIFDVHNYEQDPAVLKEEYDSLVTDGKLFDPIEKRFRRPAVYKGEPTFVSEYGGIAWNLESGGWGYGKGPATLEEFYERFKGLTDVLLDNEKMFGLCYTQLTDIEQEQNGLYYYNRTPKFDTEILKAAMSRKAAIED